MTHNALSIALSPRQYGKYILEKYLKIQESSRQIPSSSKGRFTKNPFMTSAAYTKHGAAIGGNVVSGFGVKVTGQVDIVSYRLFYSFVFVLADSWLFLIVYDCCYCYCRYFFVIMIFVVIIALITPYVISKIDILISITTVVINMIYSIIITNGHSNSTSITMIIIIIIIVSTIKTNKY